MAMNPLTAQLLGAGGGAVLNALTGGNDPTIDLRQWWGRELAQPVRDLQNEILGIEEQQFYPGQTYANLRPAQSDAYRGMIGYGQGTGGDLMGATMSQGGLGLGALGGGIDYLSGIEAPQFQFDQQTYDTVLGNLLPGLPGAFQEATRDLQRNLDWSQLPGLNQQAAATGNMASSRAGVAEGIMQGMTRDRMQDIRSQLYQNAINQAAQAGMGAGQSNIRADLGTQGQALQGFGQFANIGLPGIGNAYNLGKDLLGMQLAGGTGFQQQDQLAIQDAMDRWNFQQQAPIDRYANIFNLLQPTIPGGAGIVNQPGQANQMLAGAIQGAQLGAGLYDMFQPPPYVPQNVAQPLPGNSVAGFSAPVGGYGYNANFRI